MRETPGNRVSPSPFSGGVFFVPRTARKRSESGFYHVMLRRVCKQILFEDDADRTKFVSLVEDSSDKFGLSVIAWCLMDNHVHLLVHDTLGSLSRAVHRVGLLYARYLNAKSGGVGHVFQSRFKSEPVETEEYLLELVRYIHNNPEKAGVCPARKYRWSSYAEYAWGRDGMTDTSLVLGLLGGSRGFVRFVADRQSGDDAPDLDRRGLTPEEMLEFARDVVGQNPMQVASLPKAQRDDKIVLLSKAGLSVRKIERITGVGRNTVARAIAAARADS